MATKKIFLHIYPRHVDGTPTFNLLYTQNFTFMRLTNKSVLMQSHHFFLMQNSLISVYNALYIPRTTETPCTDIVLDKKAFFNNYSLF